MVIIFRGISGSGKSSIVRCHMTGTHPEGDAAKFLRGLRPPAHTISYSADHYFMVGSEYKFDPKYLPAAHESCLRMFAGKLEQLQNTLSSDVELIVDNTNTTLVEVIPYLALAQAYAHEVHVITLVVDPLIAYTRNKHGVPFSSIVQQDLHLKQSILDWPQRLARYQQIFSS